MPVDFSEKKRQYVLTEMGIWLMERRLAHGATRSFVVSQIVDISESQLQNYEAGQSSIPMALFLKLANFYGVDEVEINQFMHNLKKNEPVE